MSGFNEELLVEHLEWVQHELKKNPFELYTKAREIILDTLGCAHAAFHSNEINELAKKYTSIDPGIYQFNKYQNLSLANCVQLFAYCACWDEACEGNAVSHGRPGITTLAVMYPFLNKMTLKEILDIFIVSYEVTCKLAEMLRIKAGMHVDGNWPAFGSAIAASMCLGMTTQEIMKSINLTACQIPMSLYLPIQNGANGRNSYLGHAACLGLHSALAIQSGVSSPKNAILEYAQIGLENPDPQWNAHQELNLLKSYTKPFPAVRHVHYGIFAALALKDSFSATDIHRIELKIYEEAFIYCGNRAPKSPIQAQFSLSYGVACALVNHSLDFHSYDDQILNDPLVQKLEKCIEIGIDEELTKNKKRGAQLTIHSKSKSQTIKVSAIPGDTDYPMTQNEIKEKFIQYSKNFFGHNKSDQIAMNILHADLSSTWDKIYFY